MSPVQIVTGANGAPEIHTPPATVDEHLPAEGPTPEQVAETDGSLAARVQAKAQRLGRRTKRIPVPPDDVWEGELILVVKPVKVKGQTPFVKLIADATDHLELVDDRTGEPTIVPDWAALGDIMGLTGDRVSVGQIITAVCDGSQDVVNGLGEQVLAFIMGRQSLIEQALGEI